MPGHPDQLDSFRFITQSILDAYNNGEIHSTDIPTAPTFTSTLEAKKGAAILRVKALASARIYLFYPPAKQINFAIGGLEGYGEERKVVMVNFMNKVIAYARDAKDKINQYTEPGDILSYVASLNFSDYTPES